MARGTRRSCTALARRRGTADGAQANVMLSYPVPEAEELLKSKLAAAKESLDNCEEDMDFLREQITVSGEQAETSA